LKPITPEIVKKSLLEKSLMFCYQLWVVKQLLIFAISLAKNGVLKKYNVDLIGANLKAIKKAEERESFYKAMKKIGLDVPEAHIARTFDQAQKVLKKLGLPVIIRPIIYFRRHRWWHSKNKKRV
jgi:carbamoyl-phosphate synthase large subunit